MYDAEQTHNTTSSIQAPNPSGLECSESTARQPRNAALGKIRQNVDAPAPSKQENKAKNRKMRRRERFADQRTAAQIYRSMVGPNQKAAGRGVTACGWSKIANKQVKLVRMDGPDGAQAFYRGLQVCGLRWVCPCCTVKKSEESREALNAALRVARQQGLVPVMLTLTARHKRTTDLKEFWEALSQAEKQMKKSRPWRKLNARLPGGFAKAVEITHGANGWHPHFHIVMMTDAKADEDRTAEAVAVELVEDLRDEWLHQLNRVGLDGTTKAARDRSFDVRGAETVGDYITKWGAAEEMTLAATKVGKAKGRNPWELLRDARTAGTDADRMQAGALWWEFVQVMQGVHQLRQSPKFRELVKAYEPPEGEAQEEPVETASFPFDDPEWDRGRWRRLRMKEAAEQGQPEDVHQAVVEALWDMQTDADLFRDPDPDLGDVIEDIDPAGVCSAHCAHNDHSAQSSTGREDRRGFPVESVARAERRETKGHPQQCGPLEDSRRCPSGMDGCAAAQCASTGNRPPGHGPGCGSRNREPDAERAGRRTPH